MLYSYIINMHVCTYTCRIHLDAIIKTSDTVLRKIYLSLNLKGCVWERELETEQRLQHIDLTSPSWHRRVLFSFSWTAAQPEGWRPSLLGAGFLYRILSQTGLQTHWLPVFTELYNSSIAHSISGHRDVSHPLSLEWHVWLSSSRNNCPAVHRSLSSGASVYDCTAGFYLVPYCQQDSLTPMEYALPPSLEWHVWPGGRSVYNNKLFLSYFFIIVNTRIKIHSHQHNWWFFAGSEEFYLIGKSTPVRFNSIFKRSNTEKRRRIISEYYLCS